MDQDVIFLASDNEIDTVNLELTPTTADQYLKQVMRSRKQCPDVVRVEIPVWKTSQQTTANNIEPVSPPKVFDAPRWWIDKQCADFSELRRKFRERKMSKKAKTDGGEVTLPQLDDEESWREFLFEKCKIDLKGDELDSNNDATNQLNDLAKKISTCYGPRGTPPLLRVVSKLPQAYVVDALEFCCAWFCDQDDDDQDGNNCSSKLENDPVYLRELTQWLFALMCALEKPIDPDVCSSLRDLAKMCLRLKRRHGTDVEDNDFCRIYDWFICTVAYYFEQKDLAN